MEARLYLKLYGKHYQEEEMEVKRAHFVVKPENSITWTALKWSPQGCRRKATRSQIFSFLKCSDAIMFVTSSHRGPTRAFFIHCEEQKCARRGNFRLPVAIRGS